MITGLASKAVAWAKAQTARDAPAQWQGLCLRFVRTAYGLPAVHPDAHSAWHAAKGKHTGKGYPPKGVPVFWRGGRYGHVALSLGKGWCISTDYVRQGRADKVPIDTVTKGWGLQYLGWAESINGTDITGWQPPGKHKRHVPYRRRLRQGMRGTDVQDLKQHLGFTGPGRKSFGPKTRERVIAKQKAAKGALGTADGVVGPLTYQAITGHK